MLTYEIIKAIISRKSDNNEHKKKINWANKNEIEPNNNIAQT